MKRSGDRAGRIGGGGGRWYRRDQSGVRSSSWWI